MSRLSAIFSSNRKCFIPFVTAGFPDLDRTEETILQLVRAGSQIIEIGIPFSDPIADGPVIQKSSFAAVQHGYGMADFIGLVKRVRLKEPDVGLVFMTYMNPVHAFGLQRLDEEASRAGLDGLLISDLTPEEYERTEKLRNLDPIFLVAPTSTDERIQKITRVGKGFLYLVARTGVTGRQTQLGDMVPSTVARIRRYSNLPIAVGFGITTARDVEVVWKHAEGAVVGSAIVRYMDEHKDDPHLAARVGAFVRTLIPSRSES